jgi:hypothetical protein
MVNLSVMEPTFEVRADGVIEMHVDPRNGTMDTALNDAVTSRAPRGAVHAGLSTYWIDRTEQRARAAAAEGIDRPFASGNVTYLRVAGDRVVAGFDFDPDEAEAESVPLADFLAVLAAWRERVIEAGGASGEEAAQVVQEQRPWPMGPGA